MLSPEIVPRVTHFIGIGISDYIHWPRLNNAVRDVKAIETLLVEEFGVQETTMLINDDATQDKIYYTLRRLVKNVTKHDNVIIYYAGHGYYDDELKTGSWIPIDAKINKEGDLISNDRIGRFLKNIKSHHSLIFSDTCFSGSLFEELRRGDQEVNSDLDSYPSRWLICSGRDQEKVTDGEPGAHSPFAQSILDTLNDADYVSFTTSALFEKIRKKTRSKYNQLPSGGALKKLGDEGGQYIFYRVEYKEQEFWNNALHANTIEWYQSYLSHYPNGQFTIDAKAGIQSLQTAMEWDRIQQLTEDTLSQLKVKYDALNEFDNQYAGNSLYAAASNMAQSVLDKSDFLVAYNSISKLLAFVQRQTAYQEPAKIRLEELRAKSASNLEIAKTWQELDAITHLSAIVKLDSKTAIDDYLKKIETTVKFKPEQLDRIKKHRLNVGFAAVLTNSNSDDIKAFIREHGEQLDEEQFQTIRTKLQLVVESEQVKQLHDSGQATQFLQYFENYGTQGKYFKEAKNIWDAFLLKQLTSKVDQRGYRGGIRSLKKDASLLNTLKVLQLPWWPEYYPNLKVELLSEKEGTPAAWWKLAKSLFPENEQVLSSKEQIEQASFQQQYDQAKKDNTLTAYLNFWGAKDTGNLVIPNSFQFKHWSWTLGLIALLVLAWQVQKYPPPQSMVFDISPLKGIAFESKSIEEPVGMIITTDTAKLLQELERTSRDSIPAGMYGLGMVYLTGIENHLTVDEKIGDQLLNSSATAGFPPALYELGRRYEEKGMSKYEDLYQAFLYYRRAAQLGYAPAMSALADLWVYHEPYPTDTIVCLRWYHKSIQTGNNNAYAQLGSYYKSSHQYDSAYYYFELATTANNNAGRYELALMKLSGKGTEVNIDSALTLLADNASQGHQRSAYKLGQLYYEGQFDQEISYIKAYQYFSQIFENTRLPNVAFYLGELHYHQLIPNHSLQAAETFFEESLRRSKRNTRAHLYLAEIASNKGDLAKVAQMYNELAYSGAVLDSVDYENLTIVLQTSPELLIGFVTRQYFGPLVDQQVKEAELPYFLHQYRSLIYRLSTGISLNRRAETEIVLEINWDIVPQIKLSKAQVKALAELVIDENIPELELLYSFFCGSRRSSVPDSFFADFTDRTDTTYLKKAAAQKNPFALLKIGLNFYEEEGNTSATRSYLETMLTHYPNKDNLRYSILLFLGDLYCKSTAATTGPEIDKAIYCFKEALKIKPNELLPNELLCITYDKSGNDAAKDYCLKVKGDSYKAFRRAVDRGWYDPWPLEETARKSTK